jgi:hypothetical protein
VQYSGTLTLNEDNHGELILGGSPAQLCVFPASVRDVSLG